MSIKDKRDSSSPFGVLDFFPWQHPWNNQFYNEKKISQALALMQEAGIVFLRMDFLWDDLEPRPQTFSFKKYDKIIQLLSEAQIKPLGVLGYNNRWSGKAWNAAPEKELFLRFVKQVVRRYKNKVKYWEIWNEPNNVFYWQLQDRMLTYSTLLKSCYETIKKIDPSSQVLNGGLTAEIAKSLDELYTNGTKQYFDILNLHPFVNPLLNNSLQVLFTIYAQVYAVLEKHKDTEKDIWFTEIGCPGMDNPRKSACWWMGENPTEEEQAAWLKKVYEEGLRLKGVKKIFWAFFRDTDCHWHNGTDYFGLVKSNFDKKPSFFAYKSVTQEYEKFGSSTNF